jgi:hypothetical protein
VCSRHSNHVSQRCDDEPQTISAKSWLAGSSSSSSSCCCSSCQPHDLLVASLPCRPFMSASNPDDHTHIDPCVCSLPPPQRCLSVKCLNRHTDCCQLQLLPAASPDGPKLPDMAPFRHFSFIHSCFVLLLGAAGEQGPGPGSYRDCQEGNPKTWRPNSGGHRAWPGASPEGQPQHHLG